MSGGNGRLRFRDSFTLDGDAVTAAAAARLGVMAITLRHLEDTCDDGSVTLRAAVDTVVNEAR